MTQRRVNTRCRERSLGPNSALRRVDGALFGGTKLTFGGTISIRYSRSPNRPELPKLGAVRPLPCLPFSITVSSRGKWSIHGVFAQSHLELEAGTGWKLDGLRLRPGGPMLGPCCTVTGTWNLEL